MQIYNIHLYLDICHLKSRNQNINDNNYLQNLNIKIDNWNTVMQESKIVKKVSSRIKESMKNGQVTELDLDTIGIKNLTKQIKKLIEEHKKIQYLTMNDCQLVSLDNFPCLPNLAILQLSHNQQVCINLSIQDEDLFHILKNSYISHLMIDQNHLKSIQKISVLRQLPNLEQLEIAGNRIGQSDFYRQELFDRIPHLKIIDCHDKYGNIAIQSQSQHEQSDNSMIRANQAPALSLSFYQEKPHNLKQKLKDQLLELLEKKHSSDQDSQQQDCNQSAQQEETSKNEDSTFETHKKRKTSPQSFSSNEQKQMKRTKVLIQYQNQNYDIAEQGHEDRCFD